MCELHSSDSASTEVQEEQVVHCPVMPGVVVDQEEAEEAGLVREYRGERFYLCCDTCGPLFDADPAAYVKA